MPLLTEIGQILAELASELLHVLPYFLVGVALEAWIRTKKWHLKIRKALTRYGFAAIGIASLLGLISPLCACGILPLTISLILGGLPLAPAMSLLVASPLMSPAGYTLAIKNTGFAWANPEVAAALFMGLFAGTIVHLMERRGFDVSQLFRKELPKGDFHDEEYPEEILRCACNEMFSKKVERTGHGPVAVYFAKMWEGGFKVGKYLLFGLLIQVIAVRYVPDAWIDTLLTSGDPLSVIGLALAVVPLHITQITASAILFGFINPELGPFATVSPAAGMALLVGGPVTAIPVMGVFLTLFRIRVFLLYLALCLSGTLITAFVFQMLAR